MALAASMARMLLREGGGGAVSGRRRSGGLHRFQKGEDGVAMSRGGMAAYSVYVCGAGWGRHVLGGLKGIIKPPPRSSAAELHQMRPTRATEECSAHAPRETAGL